MVISNNLVSAGRQPITIFSLEILIDTETHSVTYNQNILPGKITQNSSGVVMVYDQCKGTNVQIPCNNKDNIKREELKDEGFIKYSICCTKPRIEEFKEDLVRFARQKEAELLAMHEKQTEVKTAIIGELDTYLNAADDSDSDEDI